MLKIYIAVKRGSKPYVSLKRQNVVDWCEENEGYKFFAAESEELGWMKKAADGACRFMEDTGNLDISTLWNDIGDYEQEIYHG